MTPAAHAHRSLAAKQLTASHTRALALTDVLAAVTLLGLAASLTITPVIRTREQDRRKTCAGQLRQIVTAMHAYAGRSSGAFANHGNWHSGYHQIGEKWGMPDTGRRRMNSYSRSLWRLVRDGSVAPEVFRCPSVGAAAAGAVRHSHSDVYDFPQRLSIAYSYQCQYTAAHRPNAFLTGMDSPPDLAVLADRNPLYLWVDRSPRDTKTAAPGSSAIRTVNPGVAPDDNSRNHAGAGQNVAHVGGHALWQTTPQSGLDGDHIFTRAGAGPHGSWANVSGAELSLPASDRDSLLAP